MRKFYIITGTDVRVPSDKPLVIPAEHGFRNVGGASASNTQMQDIRTNHADAELKYSALLFDRRATARQAAKLMIEQNMGGYTYSVREVGEFRRTVRPVLGYRFNRNDGGRYWFLEGFAGPASAAAYKAEVGGLIPTRALARAALPEQQTQADAHGKPGLKLSIETVYADA